MRFKGKLEERRGICLEEKKICRARVNYNERIIARAPGRAFRARGRDATRLDVLNVTFVIARTMTTTARRENHRRSRGREESLVFERVHQ